MSSGGTTLPLKSLSTWSVSINSDENLLFKVNLGKIGANISLESADIVFFYYQEGLIEILFIVCS